MSLLLVLALLLIHLLQSNAFQTVNSSYYAHHHIRKQQYNNKLQNLGVSSSSALYNNKDGNSDNNTTSEADRLLAKAKAIRESLPQTSSTDKISSSSNSIQDKIISEFSLPNKLENSFRLYIDVGREKGTWMDPRWGASGRRIECTIDASFAIQQQQSLLEEDDKTQLVSEDIAAGLMKTVTNKSSQVSQVYKLQTAPYARLRGGFDKMSILDAGFCIESTPSASSSTLRFCIDVSGTKDGDVSIPEGKLYFALPYFGQSKDTNTMALSTKEGTITVKQMGWNTGWRREESRILGIFRAVQLDKAKARDKF